MSEREPRSELECRETSLTHVRDAIASLQQVPAAGLDQPKHKTVRETVVDLVGLERALSNEVEQMRDAGEDE